MQTTAPLPAMQLWLAYKLASAYGHLWATALYREAKRRQLNAWRETGQTDDEVRAWLEANKPDCLEPATLHQQAVESRLTLKRIVELSAVEQDPDLPQGIFAPRLGSCEEIRHTTGSGRLDWVITASGHTTLYVNRQGAQEVLRVEIRPLTEDQDDYSAGDIDVYLRGACNFCHRHVAAMEFALTPLVGTEAAKSALGQAYAVADSDAPRGLRWVPGPSPVALIEACGQFCGIVPYGAAAYLEVAEPIRVGLADNSHTGHDYIPYVKGYIPNPYYLYAVGTTAEGLEVYEPLPVCTDKHPATFAAIVAANPDIAEDLQACANSWAEIAARWAKVEARVVSDFGQEG